MQDARAILGRVFILLGGFVYFLNGIHDIFGRRVDHQFTMAKITGRHPRHKSIKKIREIISQFSDLEISILYRLTNITGSIFISLSLLKGDFLEKDLFETCFLDELWQAEQWGQEEESTSKRKRIYKELKKIVTLIDLTKL